MTGEEIVKKIQELKKERDAVILVHNYQPPEIQDIADHLGDSLDLSRLAQKLPNRVIIFCGVHFMAETAAILSPEKKVILPEPTAGCPMADMLSDTDLAEVKRAYPDAVVVSYVNSTARVKALTDICCTSANALKVVESVEDGRKIIFGPDQHLAGWVASRSKRDIIPWKGFCPSHIRIMPDEIIEKKKLYPEAKVMVHPECTSKITSLADAVCGTGQMIKYAGSTDARVFIVGTEVGMIYRLKTLYPEKEFIPASENAVCKNMKKITLEKVLFSLESLKPVITVEPEIANRARTAIERMIEIV